MGDGQQQRSSVPRVLILSASAGEGHNQAAAALEAALAQHHAEARAVNVLDIAPRPYRIWFQGGYETLVKHAPRLWGRLYWMADKPGPAFAFQTWLDTVCLKRLDTVVAEYRPDWVLCTHSAAQPGLDRLARQRHGGGMRWGPVVTDLYPHRMWLRGEPDVVFLANEVSLERLAARSPLLASRAIVTGIPVHPDFAAPMPRREVRRRLGLPDECHHVLVMAGGIGGGPLADTVRALARRARRGAEGDVRVTVVCGRSRSNRERCERLAVRLAASRAELTVRGYVPHGEFRLLLRSADILVGKAGGLTASEALACGVPLVLYRPLMIPGQEEDNARYLLQHGAALSVGTPDGLSAVVEELISSPEHLAAMQEAAAVLGRPDAALVIARWVLDASRP